MTVDIAGALDFSGRQVLVTGGSDGIGLGIARAFEAAGAAVTITGTRPAEAYDNDFTGLKFIQLNVVDAASVEALAAKVDRLDVLINSVGTVLYESREFERDGFEQVISVNLTGIMHLCTALAEKLAESGGSIVNLDSLTAHQAARNNPAYSASKAGLLHLNRALAIRWGKKGVRVNGIGPGVVPTKITENWAKDETAQMIEARMPLGRLGTPDDMAGVALFLASPLASYVTGQSIPVDGGLGLLGAL